MDFVVLPTKTLCDPNSSPLLLRQEPKSSSIIRIEELLRDQLEERFGQDYMPVLIFIIRISIRVMNPIVKEGILLVEFAGFPNEKDEPTSQCILRA